MNPRLNFHRGVSPVWLVALILAGVLFPASTGRAEEKTDTGFPPATTPEGTQVESAAGQSQPTEEGSPKAEWSFSGSLSYYYFPDGGSYAQPIFSADRNHLHLEARYNYEDASSASAFWGWNLEFGNEFHWQLTPILGLLGGNTQGIIPGLETTFTWKKLEVYSEGEYVFNREGKSENFYYNWLEASYAPTDWIRAGIVAQRTKRFETDLDVQRGLLVGSSYNNFNYTFYFFNPFNEDAYYVLTLGIDF